MTRPAHIIRKNSEIPGLYHTLAAGDIIACRLSLKYEEEHLLLDLLERGIHLIPSATSQLASRSKTFQTRLLAPYMIRHTAAIYDIHGLLNTISLYGHHDVGKVVLKHDRKNAGLGINLYGSIEDIYNQATNNCITYPFVVQPFVPASRDIRVIILGDYTEAYERKNPDNFRNNLHCGGAARPCQLNTDQIDFCEKIMTRASFPYGHLDLMITEENETYLAEINLRGGIRGAAINPANYQKKVKAVEETLLQEIM